MHGYVKDEHLENLPYSNIVFVRETVTVTVTVCVCESKHTMYYIVESIIL